MCVFQLSVVMVTVDDGKTYSDVHPRYVSTRRDVGMLVSARTLNVLVYGCRHEATSSLVFIYILVLSNCIIVLYNGILALLN